MDKINNRKSCLGLNSEVQAIIKQAQAAGAKVDYQAEAGTVTVKNDGRTIYRGIRKGNVGQPWIVTFDASVFR